MAPLATAAIVVTACGVNDEDEAPTSAVTSTADASDQKNNTSSEEELYNATLDSIDVDYFKDNDFPGLSLNDQFDYSMVDVDADGTNELLIKAKGSEFSAIRVVAINNDKLVEPSKVFHEGAASAGGARRALEANLDGGLLETESQSGTGETTTIAWSFNGAEMDSGQTWYYRSDKTPADLKDLTAKIEWHPIADRSEVANLESTQQDKPKTRKREQRGAAPKAQNPGQIGGVCGTYDGRTVEAGKKTSCGFAMNVAFEASQPIYVKQTPDPTVTPAGQADITASSPTTGMTYTMHCSVGTAESTITCRGGDDALVRIGDSSEPNVHDLVIG